MNKKLYLEKKIIIPLGLFLICGLAGAAFFVFTSDEITAGVLKNNFLSFLPILAFLLRRSKVPNPGKTTLRPPDSSVAMIPRLGFGLNYQICSVLVQRFYL